MQSINRRGSALRPRSAVAFWAMHAMGLVAMAWPGEALAWTGQPLAYVTDTGHGTVSVIDTGDNTVVNTVPVGQTPAGLPWRQTGNMSMS
jgi:YVTN family beta-propeller protein